MKNSMINDKIWHIGILNAARQDYSFVEEIKKAQHNYLCNKWLNKLFETRGK